MLPLPLLPLLLLPLPPLLPLPLHLLLFVLLLVLLLILRLARLHTIQHTHEVSDARHIYHLIFMHTHDLLKMCCCLKVGR